MKNNNLIKNKGNKLLVFVLTFWSYRKQGLIRKIRFTSKFMMLQAGLQTIAIHLLLNIS